MVWINPNVLILQYFWPLINSKLLITMQLRIVFDLKYIQNGILTSQYEVEKRRHKVHSHLRMPFDTEHNLLQIFYSHIDKIQLYGKWKPYYHTFELKLQREIQEQSNRNISQRRRVHTYSVNFYCNRCSCMPSELQSCRFTSNTIKPLPCWPQTALRRYFTLPNNRTTGIWAMPFHFTRRHLSDSESNYTYWSTRNFHPSKEKGSLIPNYSILHASIFQIHTRILSWNKLKMKPCLSSNW